MEVKKMGMYIHIPFCSRKCDYCDFVSYSMDKSAQKDYFEALMMEIDQVKGKYVDEVFDTLYIGGGTPSIVYEGFIASLSRKLFSSFHFADDMEFTIEINPASFTQEKFFEYVEAGVNRISVGVQCINSNLMASHGRIQTLKDIDKTFNILNSAQFSNVNADVMIGIPNQSKSDIDETLTYLISKNVQHISTYSLQIEKGTVIDSRVRKKEILPVYDKKVFKQYLKVCALLKANGYKRYEVSNFSRPGFASRHNMKYWDNSNFLGLGVSAYSYIDNYRFSNTKRVDTYIDNIREGKSARHIKQYISKKDRRTERIMLGLRTERGLDLEAFKKEFNEDLLESKEIELKVMMKEGMLEIVDGFLKVCENYFYVINPIIVELM